MSTTWRAWTSWSNWSPRRARRTRRGRGGRMAVGSSRQVRLTLAEPERRLLGRIRAHLAGRGVRVYLAGGFLRDRLLGRSARDVDLVAEGDPLAISRDLASAVAATA